MPSKSRRFANNTLSIEQSRDGDADAAQSIRVLQLLRPGIVNQSNQVVTDSFGVLATVRDRFSMDDRSSKIDQQQTNFIGGYFGTQKIRAFRIQFQAGARPPCTLGHERPSGRGHEFLLDQLGRNQSDGRPSQTKITSQFCSGKYPLLLQQPQNTRLVNMTEKGGSRHLSLT